MYRTDVDDVDYRDGGTQKRGQRMCKNYHLLHTVCSHTHTLTHTRTLAHWAQQTEISSDLTSAAAVASMAFDWLQLDCADDDDFDAGRPACGVVCALSYTYICVCVGTVQL